MRELVAIALAEDDGRKLAHFARQRIGLSSHQLAAAKARGGLFINGISRHADAILHEGDLVTVRLEDPPRAPTLPDPTPVDVVYEDEDILVIDKPAPLACQCSPKQDTMTLENRLAWRYREDSTFVFRPLNRLDRGTSGLMAAAKNARACWLMQRGLHTEDFAREYIAIVEGVLRGEGVIDAPIAKVEAASVRREVRADGQRAVTHYRAEDTDGARTRVRLRLETGRTHQIRVHLAHIGHPIAGDFLYGQEIAALPGRFALHSTRIRFVHPTSGEIVERESPLPKLLSQLLEE